MNSNDKIWINQQLMYYKDNLYGSDGVLELSLATSTQDFKNFNSTNLNISVISNNNRRLVNLSYTNVVDLILSFQEVMKNLDLVFDNGRNNEIVKKFHDKNLKIEFKLSTSKERIVIIYIIHTNSDFTRVIIPYYVFSGLSKLINTFACDYIKINFELVNRTLLSELLDNSKQIQNGIKVLPSMIGNINPDISTLTSSGFISAEFKEEIEEVYDNSTQVGEFGKFIENNIDNMDIGISDIKPKEESINAEASSFISKTLKNDLMVLEDLLNSLSMTKNPFKEILNLISENAQFNLIPEIDPQDYNSICYFSKIYQNTIIKEYTLKSIPVKPSVTILRYEILDISKIKSENVELAYDILTINLYLKVLKNLLDKKIEDSFSNKTIFMLNTRLFLDPLCFTFIDNKDVEVIKSSIITRFKKFESIGFFNRYNETLDMYGISKITEKDIVAVMEIILDKVIGKCVDIKVTHSQSYNVDNLKLPYDSNLTIEQIINLVIPLETMHNLGIEMSDEALEVEVGVKKSDIPKEIIELFTKEKPKEVKVKEEPETNIVRFAKSYSTDIPKIFRDEFLYHLKEIGLNDYDFKNEIFPIEELGEELVKGLYEWNESENKKEPFSSYSTKRENTLMTKDLVISKIKNKVEKITVDENWDFNVDEI